jgi:protein phosphatase
MLIAQGVTDRGRVRTTNEDALLCEPALGLFVVADGMGGHQAGEVASALAVEAIKSFLARSQQSQDFTWPYGIDPALSFHANRLMTAIKLANRRVVKAGESREDYAGLGTTVVAALVVGGRLFYAGVGDSRIYLHANGRIEQMTQDDSWAATVLGQSGMDNDAIASNPLRNVLTKVLGAREQLDVDVHERALSGNETLLLCSDGLHGVLNEATIAKALSAPGAPGDIAQALVQLALDHKSADNVTALVVRASGTV